MLLWKNLRQAMLCHPFQTIGEDQSTMTFEELAAFAESFAKELKEEMCCAIYCHSEFAAAMALFSCFAAQKPAVLLSPRYGQVHCQKILEAIGPSCIITDTYGMLQVCRLADCHYVAPKEQPALIMCTSGTTGTPKGILLSEENVLCNLWDIAEYFQIEKEDTILISRPLYHCAVLTGELLCALVKGVRIRFSSAQFDPISLIQKIREEKITAFCGTPTLMRTLARFLRGGSSLPLKHIAVSGECMDADTGKVIRSAFPKANIYHVYGLTEAAPRVSYLPPQFFDKAPDCVGIPLRSVKLRILSEDGKEVKKGTPGILWIKGGNIMQGYYQNPNLTKSVLKKGWLCTKDIAVMTKEGFLQIKGRADDMIIRAGMNIYPAEIEAALKADPRTKEVLVFGEKQGTDVRIAMKIVGDYTSVSEVKALCVQVLPPFQVPGRIELVAELSKSGSGKIIRGGNT